ncbi:MAG: tRNA (N6-isopentenyl adenosine(37)-C2)-methylthiotransferase MiaB [Vampirovibrionales bacterium]
MTQLHPSPNASLTSLSQEDGLREEGMSRPRKVYVETLGCQMNVSDSELMLGLLAREGFVPTEDKTEADLMILNTCQIRDNAEGKAYSYLGRWGKLKKDNPHVKIAMAGCVAQQTKEDVFERAKYVDLVFGTQNIHELPRLVRRLFDAGETHVLAVDRQREGSTYDYFSDITAVRKSHASAWVTIIEGCDYFCTYCVVPYTRGRQISRSPESIIEEVRTLASQGYKEFTLLGQTVDAYGKDFTNRSYDLADLFHAVSQISGVERIRFMTSHPLDLSDKIIEAIATLPNVMPYIHIPMQAGSTEILTRMKRGYTADAYYALVDKIYDRIPNVAVTGDYIVGFPGETEAHFQDTLYSVGRARKHAANTAAYSPRKQTPAGIWEHRGEGVVSEEEKQERLQRLNAVITEESAKQNAMYAQTQVTLLVEGPSRRNPNRLMGRTPQNKVVNFDLIDPQTSRPLPPEAVARCTNYLVGQFLQAHIIETAAWALLGTYEVPMPLLETIGYIGCEEHQLV